ncbi:MAG: urea transporter permease, partial [Pseudonocardiales bacterium]|nr:urea transporter permease [Pseudonocardiales bacterium]
LGGGAVAGLPALRVTGIYLALFSLALATVFPAFLQHFASVTGGSEGLSAPTYTPFFTGISQDKWSYYLALVIAIPIFLLVHDFGRSRVGRALRGLRESEPAVTSIGVNVTAYKISAFALSGGLAAIGGSLWVLVQPYPYIDPRSFTIALSISLVTGLVVGGAGSVFGAVVAALFLDRVPQLTTDVAHLNGVATNFFYGGLLIALMFLMPTGAVGLASRVSTRVSSSALLCRSRPNR